MGPSAPFFVPCIPWDAPSGRTKREKREKARRAATPRTSIALFFSRRKVQGRFYKRAKPLAIRTGRKTVPQRRRLFISDEHGQRCAGRGTRELVLVKCVAQEAPRQNQRTAGRLSPAKPWRVFARGPQWTDAPTSGLRPDTSQTLPCRIRMSQRQFQRLQTLAQCKPCGRYPAFSFVKI
jgi:hypothetical protein